MKLFPFRVIAFCFSSAIILSSCSKSTEYITPATPQSDIHVYGLNPMQPSDWANIPVFSPGNLPQGITYTGTLPGAYLLNSPNVRDQGQIGSCTGFCGTETNEMVKYYKSNSNSISGVNYSNGVSTAISNQIPNTSQTSNSSALSPLFLYYVERCVIEKQSIGSDPGANMVNIGQALQGLTNNTGTGATLTETISRTKYTFAGESIESDYTYPWVTGSGGYNVASPTSANYRTVPSGTAISNAPSYEIAKNPSGSSTSTGSTTTGGYYVINSSSIINDVETAIASNLPVMMGFNVYDNKSTYTYFEGLNTTSYVYNPITSTGSIISGLKLLGGHAVPLIGYITNASDNSIPSSYGGGVFIVENSWGTPWGNHGYFYLPFNVLTNTNVVPAGSLFVLVK